MVQKQIIVDWSQDALADLNRFAVFLQEKHPELAAIVVRDTLVKLEPWPLNRTSADE